MSWTSDDHVLTVDQLPPQWNEKVAQNAYMNSRYLKVLGQSSSVEFRMVDGEDFSAVEYDLKLNAFSFSRILPKWYFRLKVIGLPVSVSRQGFSGDYSNMLDYYKKRSGFFLVLNMESSVHSIYKTLPTCVFDNKFKSFDEYFLSLRSPYRRRLNKVITQGNLLEIRRIDNRLFDDHLYSLYLQVFNKSDYPLEQQRKDFFLLDDLDIDVFYENGNPIAFVATTQEKENLNFVFGGMDYSKRDQYDLYQNMLLFIMKKGINEGFSTIDFGQTAENSKLRLGCHLENRYISLLHKNPFVQKLLTPLTKLFEYKADFPEYHVFNKKD